MKKLLTKSASILMAAGLLLTACSTAKSDDKSSSEPSVTTAATDDKLSGKVLFWHTYSDEEEKILLDKVIPSFKEKNPDVTVEAVRMPVEGLKQQLITAVSGGVAPDAMRLDIIWTPEFAKMGVLEKLDDKQGFSELKDIVFEGPLATCKYEDGYYGLPLNTNTKIAIWSKDLLAAAGLSAPPATFDEFEAAAKKVSDGKKVWGYGLGSPECWNFIPIFMSMGGQFTNEEITKATGYINSDESVKIVEKMVEWYDNGLIGQTVFGEEPGTWGGITAGNYLMIDDGPWYFSLAEDFDKVVPSLYPSGKGGSVSVVGGENIVNFNTGKNKAATWAFTQHMLSDEAQLAMLDAGVITVKSTLTTDPKVKDNEILQLYLKQLETAAARTVHPSFNKINEDVRLCLEKALRKDGEVKALLDALAVSMDAALAE